MKIVISWFVFMFCILIIGLMPIYIGMFFSVTNKFASFLLILSVCISFPIGIGIMNFLFNKYNLKCFPE